MRHSLFLALSIIYAIIMTILYALTKNELNDLKNKNLGISYADINFIRNKTKELSGNSFVMDSNKQDLNIVLG